MERHHQTVLTHLGCATNQTAQLPRDSDDPVAMMEESSPAISRMGRSGWGSTRGQDSLVVGSAESLGRVWPRTVDNGAEPAWLPQRHFAYCSISEQPLIVAMAKTPRFGIFVTIRGLALRLLSLDRAGRPWISRSQHPSVVHFAHSRA